MQSCWSALGRPIALFCCTLDPGRDTTRACPPVSWQIHGTQRQSTAVYTSALGATLVLSVVQDTQRRQSELPVPIASGLHMWRLFCRKDYVGSCNLASFAQ